MTPAPAASVTDDTRAARSGTGVPARNRPRGRRRWGALQPPRGTVLRAAAAVAGGVLLYTGFPPRSWWFLAPVGIAVLVISVRGVPIRTALVLGYLAGLGLFVPLLPWVGVYVGALPWLALAAVEALAVAAFAALAAWVSPLPGAALWSACGWVATEAVRARLPFGGFPWGRLAFAQADGPLLPIARLAGAPGVTFTVALIGAALAAAATAASRRNAPRSVGAAAAVLATVYVLVAASHPPAPAPGMGTTVAAVQGNVPRLGLEFNAQRRAVLDNHVARTEQLAADVAAGVVPKPDLVIWPENASDIDPLRNRDAAERIGAAARAIDAPLLVGAVLSPPSGAVTNTALVWDPSTGPGPAHDKRRLVPFGEYLPLRRLVETISPYAARAGNFVPGSGNGVLTLGRTPIAVATCYEVAFDDLVSESVRAGAQLITVPTNNATFGDTAMTYQQLAMSRLRAVEHNRAVVVAATSGVSAVIAPTGEVLARTTLFTADALVARVPLETGLTPATRLRARPEFTAVALALAAVAAEGARRRRTGDRR